MSEAEIRARLAEWYTPEEVEVWLTSRHALLGWQRAIDLIHAGREAEVLRVINAFDEGVYL